MEYGGGNYLCVKRSCHGIEKVQHLASIIFSTLNNCQCVRAGLCILKLKMVDICNLLLTLNVLRKCMHACRHLKSAL